MKYPKLYGFGLSFLFCCTISFAQDRVVLREPDHNKPALFSQLSDKLPVNVTELETMFFQTSGRGTIELDFLDKTIPGFRGKLVSATSKYDNTLRSVVINSTRFNGATLTFSSSTATDGTVRYAGRIVSFQNGDLFVLEQHNDQYFFVKKKFHEVVSE